MKQCRHVGCGHWWYCHVEVVIILGIHNIGDHVIVSISWKYNNWMYQFSKGLWADNFWGICLWNKSQLHTHAKMPCHHSIPIVSYGSLANWQSCHLFPTAWKWHTSLTFCIYSGVCLTLVSNASWPTFKETRQDYQKTTTCKSITNCNHECNLLCFLLLR